MAKKAKTATVTYQGETFTRGDRITKGAWRLLNKDNKKVFVGSLVDTINVGKYRLAIFSVPK
ncbi:hypothetical protein [Bradyrhizobium sp. CCBAU 53415]|uniref:hypothetical protein n=1 Tax=Bradyrhizobium sp. CCBAU 53415 TaxID=1325119 RepID=UPI002306C7B6|nr:hypothetical protein [Bradyrhizobium sp. CCBAU 53415]MDA9466543.1 hypothetical protein [Bradyrhizobium sp. CCBAU 53415]